MLRDEIIRFARSYSFEEGHSLQDERLALRLFDETARLGLHALADAEPAAGELRPRALLSAAALLHDIGYVEGYERHHKTAFRLIVERPIPGLAPRSQTLIAHIARYHRGSVSDPARHAAFAVLPPEDQRLVTQLGATLRFADGLDRSHSDAVQDIRCTLDAGRLNVALLPGIADEAERFAGQKKARWFESVFGVSVLLK
ncbi:MAG: guanosine pentaphosphate phosphohydrolase [Chloroflexi bacterium ADurb.Bin325]|nr:MAG: guanosine pentaphosphate phosphohydrolase [Chloroflexi bacterium ADurb.Bin325]